MSYYTLTPINFNPFEAEKEIEKIVFTNEPQREIWLSCIIGGDQSNLAYNESVSLDLTGVFYPKHFLSAIQDVVWRHEALRATVSGDGESLIVYKNISFEIPFEDISEERDQITALKKFIAGQMQSVFDLQKGPLFKTYLHKLADNHYYFTIVKHHIIGDGWSTGVILEDLSKLYNAKVKGTDLILAPAPQISKYADDMEQFKKSKAYQQTKEYWLNMYKDQVPVLNFPTDFSRPLSRTYHANRIDRQLSLGLVNQLKEMGAKAGCSLVNTMLSAFEIFLYLQTNQRDIVVGLPAAGQSATGDFGLVGHCVNLLPLKTTINPEKSFTEYLKKRKSAFFDAYDHQMFTFSQLIKLLKIKRDQSRVPLAPIVFNIDMGMDNSVAFDNLNYQLISNPRAYETFEIFLNATGSKSAFTFEWSYNKQLFKAETIVKIAEEFEELLQVLANNPAIVIKELSLKQTDAWKKKIQQWNNTDAVFPNDKAFTNLIDEYGLKSPQKTAVVYKNKCLNYQELIERSNQFACYLIGKGIKIGDIIGLASDRSIEMLVCLLGILKSGAVYVPLDPEYPHERIEFMLSDSKAKILLVSEIYSGRFKSEASEIIIDNLQAELAGYQNQIPAVQLTGTNLAYILYTSGSTGKPKGVKISHHNLMNFLLSMQSEPGITEQDRLLAITTISFDIAGLELYLPLISGAELIICDSETSRDGRLLLDLIKQKGITIMQATPSTWRMMIDSGWTTTPSLKVLCGGEALSKELADCLVDKSAELWNMYGPTETTIWSTIKKIQKEDVVLTIGRPIKNTQIYILNEAHDLLAPGITGEIFIGGQGVAAGYLNREELTNERFINDSFSGISDAKLYKTGDLGKFLEHGEILYQGRIDEQVKIRGHRIELGEIETVLLGQEEIKQAVVVAREDHLEQKRLVAYVILKDNEPEEHIPSWKDRWDTIYDMAAKSGDTSDPDKKIDGVLLEQWENSEDLLKQADEWLNVSAKRIRELNAKHILEIGSGGGQLLFELAPYCETYLATDYAEVAIDKLKEKLGAAPEKWKHVVARANPADDFSAIASSFDLILIHSVAQYFADTAYFLRVIEESIKRINNEGCLFIGDMQGMNSLMMYHATDHLSHAKGDTTLSEFEEVVNNRVRIEDEFVADPGFFYLLPKLLPQITGIDVQLRKGQSQNETTKYHYDVWIYVNSKHQTAKPDLRLKWEELKSLDLLENQLKSNEGKIIEVKNIFNTRTEKDSALINWMSSADKNSTVLHIKNELQDIVSMGQHPDVFWQMGQQYSYRSHVRWTTDGTDGNFDVVFIPDSLPNTLPEPPSPELLSGLKPDDFARTPLSINEVHLSKSTIDSWRESLRCNLPDYMIPGDFVALKAFPLTPNHKIDKNALPKPQSKVAHADKADQQLDEHQKIVSDIWAATLGLKNINIKDDFFELGGHSLLAVKVMAAIEKETGKRLPLATLFENSTIEKLAKRIHIDEDVRWESLVPIKTSGSKPPVFMIHGGGLNILLFKTISALLHEEQPVYGLQARGLSKPAQILYTIEEIAEVYISEIMDVYPNGPYLLTGYSLGGIIAFEMARQLTAMGKEIRFLGVVDTYAGNMKRKNDTESKILKKVRRQFLKIPFFTKAFINHPMETLIYQWNYIKRKIDKTIAGDSSSGKEHLTAYEQEIMDSYDIAINRYIMSEQEFKISFFRVNKRIYYIDDQVYLGWDKFAKKGIDIHVVPGDHRTFLHPPNDKEFAVILQSALNEAVSA